MPGALRWIFGVADEATPPPPEEDHLDPELDIHRTVSTESEVKGGTFPSINAPPPPPDSSSIVAQVAAAGSPGWRVLNRSDSTEELIGGVFPAVKDHPPSSPTRKRSPSKPSRRGLPPPAPKSPPMLAFARRGGRKSPPAKSADSLSTAVAAAVGTKGKTSGAPAGQTSAGGAAAASTSSTASELAPASAAASTQQRADATGPSVTDGSSSIQNPSSLAAPSHGGGARGASNAGSASAAKGSSRNLGIREEAPRPPVQLSFYATQQDARAPPPAPAPSDIPHAGSAAASAADEQKPPLLRQGEISSASASTDGRFNNPHHPSAPSTEHPLNQAATAADKSAAAAAAAGHRHASLPPDQQQVAPPPRVRPPTRPPLTAHSAGRGPASFSRAKVPPSGRNDRASAAARSYPVLAATADAAGVVEGGRSESMGAVEGLQSRSSSNRASVASAGKSSAAGAGLLGCFHRKVGGLGSTRGGRVFCVRLWSFRRLLYSARACMHTRRAVLFGVLLLVGLRTVSYGVPRIMLQLARGRRCSKGEISVVRMCP